MTESMIVEAVRAVGAETQQVSAAATAGTEDPAAVARFESAMGVSGPQQAAAADPIPFASEAAAAWRSAQANNQGILHRIRALSELGRMHGPASIELVELQYEVMNLSFQQEVVSKVADKSSNAIQTLVKNQ